MAPHPPFPPLPPESAEFDAEFGDVVFIERQGAVRYDTAQALTPEEQAQARDNIGINSVSGAVRYDEAQTLTDAEKTQARDNIDAAAPEDFDFEATAALAFEGSPITFALNRNSQKLFADRRTLTGTFTASVMTALGQRFSATIPATISTATDTDGTKTLRITFAQHGSFLSMTAPTPPLDILPLQITVPWAIISNEFLGTRDQLVRATSQSLDTTEKAQARSNIDAASATDLTAHTGDSDIHVTASDKTAWSAKYDLPGGGIPDTDLDSDVRADLAAAGSALQPGRITDRGLVLIEAEQTSTTAAWVGTAPFETLEAGQMILYHLTQASSSNVTLELTLSGGGSTGAIEVYYRDTTRMATQFDKNSYVLMVYNGTSWWSGTTYKDADTYDRVRHSNNVKIGNSPIPASRFCCMASDLSGYTSAAEAGATISILYPIFYTSTQLNAGSNYGAFYECFPSVSLRDAAPGITVTAQRMIYLVGTLSGTTFTVDANIFSEEPTVEDTKVYIPLGLSYSAYQIYFNGGIPRLFGWKNSVFGPL